MFINAEHSRLPNVPGVTCLPEQLQQVQFRFHTLLDLDNYQCAGDYSLEVVPLNFRPD